MHADHTPTPATECDLHCVTVIEAARYLPTSRGALYTLLTDGQLNSIHIGRARRIPTAELERFVRALLPIMTT